MRQYSAFHMSLSWLLNTTQKEEQNVNLYMKTSAYLVCGMLRRFNIN